MTALDQQLRLAGQVLLFDRDVSDLTDAHEQMMRRMDDLDERLRGAMQ